MCRDMRQEARSIPRRWRLGFSPARGFLIAGFSVWLTACGLWPAAIHPEFVETFVEVNRHGDDLATTVAFDPANRVLAVGRESGRLELWDVRKANARLLVEAHSARTEHVTFGSVDRIVLTHSAFDDRTKVWDVRSGKLLHEIEGSRGPAVASAIPGAYLVSRASGLSIYDHAQRAVMDSEVASFESITALGAGPDHNLVAVGTASGSLHLLTLEKAGASLKVTRLREVKPYDTGNWIQAVAFQDRGRRLVSVTRAGEVAAWDVATLKQQRVLPTSLRHVNWASFAPGEPWLLLAGTLEPEGLRDGKVELVDLKKGVALRFKANTTLPRAVLLPRVSTGLILQGGSVKRIRYLDE